MLEHPLKTLRQFFFANGKICLFLKSNVLAWPKSQVVSRHFTDETFETFTYFAIGKKELSKRFQGIFQHFQVWFNANGISILMQMTVPLTVVTVFSVIFHTFSMNLPSESGKTTTFLIKVWRSQKSHLYTWVFASVL